MHKERAWIVTIYKWGYGEIGWLNLIKPEFNLDGINNL